ncbi:hypothetical protein [Candidatus Kryptobacter tengchongensis]|uniref:Lipoprotein n=1 Tax=Kryptobacter tengchongensis TaxID=1643429 RepID=A0A916LKM5_KRYT1|nr:hypothetical protein [Candidatus Kryptobacter tengchongensis]CUT04136.1 hypothetical protein JGI25_01360 [Candidatus Kryptobacter tengchongensis]
MMKKVGSILLISLFVIFVAGCTKYAKDEEIQQLNNLKAEVEPKQKNKKKQRCKTKSPRKTKNLKNFNLKRKKSSNDFSN